MRLGGCENDTEAKTETERLRDNEVTMMSTKTRG